MPPKSRAPKAAKGKVATTKIEALEVVEEQNGDLSSKLHTMVPEEYVGRFMEKIRKHPSLVNNPYLLMDVAGLYHAGEVDQVDALIASGDPYSVTTLMLNEREAYEINVEALRGKVAVTRGIVSCRFCKSDNTVSTMGMTARADEAQRAFIYCADCHKSFTM